MRYPLDPPFHVSQYFGESPDIYARFGLRGHNGVDFAAPMLTPILAAQDGRVAACANDPDGYGKHVRLQHAGGLLTLYAHLADTQICVGDDVKADQVIARVGSTGFSTGPHLHFEVRLDNVSVDPLPFLAPPPAADDKYQVSKHMVVIAGVLNLRAGPGTSYPVVGHLYAGDRVDVLELAHREVWVRLVSGSFCCMQYKDELYLQECSNSQAQ